MKAISPLLLGIFYLLLPISAFAQSPSLPPDFDQKIGELQKQLGNAVDVVTMGLEIYQVVNSPDVESALDNFVAKTGIKLYPSLLLKTKNTAVNTFFSEFAQLRYSSFQEPYLLLELTFSDSTAAFKVVPSPGLGKNKKKIQELCNVHIGGFMSGKNKFGLLGNVPKFSLSLRDLADAFVESGIVDKVGQGLKNLYEIAKGVLNDKMKFSWIANKKARAERDSLWKLVEEARNRYFSVDLDEEQDTNATIIQEELPNEMAGMTVEQGGEKDTSNIEDTDLKGIMKLEDTHYSYKMQSLDWKGRVQKIVSYLTDENLQTLVAKMADQKQIQEVAIAAISGDEAKLKSKVSDYIDSLLAAKE